jgi:hypothetical protein
MLTESTYVCANRCSHLKYKDDRLWSNLLLIMIKLKWLQNFSTIRFSEEYTRTFELSRQMRSCISLQELTEFVQKNDKAIQQYGKTIALEYFNEFPVSFSYRTIKSELKVFEYVLGLTDLSAYEEQLRYANICKLIEYAPWDAREL